MLIAVTEASTTRILFASFPQTSALLHSLTSMLHHASLKSRGPRFLTRPFGAGEGGRSREMPAMWQLSEYRISSVADR